MSYLLNSYILSSPITTNGLVLNLDVANSISYPGSGTIWYDLSGNNNNATLNGSPTYSSNYGKSFQFNGSNQWANIPVANASSNFKNMTAYSIIVSTIALSSGTTWECIATWGDGVNFVDIWKAATTRYFGDDSSGSYSTVDLYSAGFNVWTVTKSVADGSKIYRNNNLIKTTSVASMNSAATTYDFSIARDSQSATYYYSSYIALVAVYNRVLSSTEVTDNFNNLRSRYGI